MCWCAGTFTCSVLFASGGVLLADEKKARRPKERSFRKLLDRRHAVGAAVALRQQPRVARGLPDFCVPRVRRGALEEVACGVEGVEGAGQRVSLRRRLAQPGAGAMGGSKGRRICGWAQGAEMRRRCRGYAAEPCKPVAPAACKLVAPCVSVRKLAPWMLTLVRVRLPGGVLVQAAYHPQEPVEHIMSLVLLKMSTRR